MDSIKRRILIEKTKQQGLPRTGHPLPIVSLEEFFTGNDDEGSIGCNLIDHPGTPAFYDTLRAIRARPDVQDVLIEIYEVEEDDESMWPFSEGVYILTSALRAEIEAWMAPLQSDEIAEGYPFGVPAAAPPLAPGMRVYAAWWD
jgi:hypothetical protein